MRLTHFLRQKRNRAPLSFELPLNAFDLGQTPVFSYVNNIARIGYATQCHSLLSGHYHCHDLRFSIFQCVVLNTDEFKVFSARWVL